MKRLIINILLLVFIAWVASAQAQVGASAQQGPIAATAAAHPDSLGDRALEAVVISASRSANPLFRSPESIRTLSRAQIERRQARTAPEALFATNGLFVQKTNHGGGSPFLRGLTGNQTLLLLDGLRLNNASFRYGPNQYLNTIDLFSIENMEVLAGSGSTQYGSDALGGIVALFSQMPEFVPKARAHGRVLARLQTQGMEQTLRGDIGLAGQRAAVAGGMTWRQFGDLVGGDSTGRQSPTGYAERALDLRARLALRKNWQVSAMHRSLVQQRVPVFHKVRLENFGLNEFEPQTKHISWLKNEWTGAPGKFLEKMTLTLSHQQGTEGRRSQKNGSSTLRLEEDRVRTLAAVAQADLRWLPGQKTALGAEIYHDKVRSSRLDRNLGTGSESAKRGLYPDGASMSSAALFLLQHYQTRRWTLSGGLRGNFFDIRVDDPDNGAVRLRPAAWVGSLGALRTLGRGSALFVAFNSAFRAPNVDDLGTLGIVDFRFELPNYQLRPEKSYNSQLGYRFRRKTLQAEVALFHNVLHDLIARVRQGADSLQGYPVYLKINAEQGYIQGAEASLRWRFLPRFSAELATAYAFGQNSSRKEPLRRIPPLNGRFALDFEQNRWFCTAECLFADKQDRLAQGDRDDNRIPAGGTPGWVVLNVHAGWSAPHWRIALALQNLSNADYRYHGSGLNGVGRSASLDLSFRW
jgi:outer membrane receptor protein involved in Fe transport